MTLTHKDRTNEDVPRGITDLGLVAALGSVLAIMPIPASPQAIHKLVRQPSKGRYEKHTKSTQRQQSRKSDDTIIMCPYHPASVYL